VIRIQRYVRLTLNESKNDAWRGYKTYVGRGESREQNGHTQETRKDRRKQHCRVKATTTASVNAQQQRDRSSKLRERRKLTDGQRGGRARASV